MITSDESIGRQLKDKEMEHSSQTHNPVVAQHEEGVQKNLISPDSTIGRQLKDKGMEHSSQTKWEKAAEEFCYVGKPQLWDGAKSPDIPSGTCRLHRLKIDGVHAGDALQHFPPDLYTRYPNTDTQTHEEMVNDLPSAMDKKMAPCKRVANSYCPQWFPAGYYQMAAIFLDSAKIPSKWEDRLKWLAVVAKLLTTPLNIIGEAFGPHWAIRSEFFSNIELREDGLMINNLYMTTPTTIQFIHYEWDEQERCFSYVSHGHFLTYTPKEDSPACQLVRNKGLRLMRLKKAQRAEAVELEKQLRKKKRQIRQAEQQMKRLLERPVQLLAELLTSVTEPTEETEHKPNITLVITEYEHKPTEAELYDQMVRADMEKVQRQRRRKR